MMDHENVMKLINDFYNQVFRGMIALVEANSPKKRLFMDDKITIIEGPPPTFEAVNDEWSLGLIDSQNLGEIAVTRVRTFNGPALVERCYRAWHNKQPIHLEFRTEDGLQHEAPIVAARYLETDEGHLLILWVRLTDEEVELELGYEDDAGDSEDDDSDYPSWNI